MHRVGNRGVYQWLVFILSLLLYIQNGIIATSPAYLFMNPSFDCTDVDPTFTEQQC